MTKKKPDPKALKNYTYDEKKDTFFDKDGEEVTHKGTINFLRNKKDFKPNNKLSNGRIEGSKNSATILKQMLSLPYKNIETGEDIEHPLDPNQKQLTVEEAIGAALLQEALAGNIKAIQEVQDTLHGKMVNVNEIGGKNGEALPVMIVDNIPKK